MSAHGDTIVVHDPQQTRTSTFLLDGTFLKTWPSMCCHWRNIQADEQGLVGIPGTVRRDTTVKNDPFGGQTTGWVRFRMDGTVVDTVIQPPSLDGKFWQVVQGGGATRWYIPLQPQRVATFDRRGMLVHGINDHMELLVSRNGVDTVRIFSAPMEPVAASDSMREALYHRIVDRNKQAASIAKVSDIPGVLPAFSTPIFDDSNNAWIPVPFNGKQSGRFAVFSSDGMFLGLVPIPESTVVNGHIRGDHLFAIGEEDDVPVIKIWKIVRAK
jgi:hypothetical protein